MGKQEVVAVSLAVALALLVIGALGKRVAEGQRGFRRQQLYLDMDLMLAALSAQAAYLAANRNVPPASVGTYVVTVNISVLFLIGTVVLFFVVAHVHDTQRRRSNRLRDRLKAQGRSVGRKELIPEIVVLGVVGNLLGLVVLFSFVTLFEGWT